LLSERQELAKKLEVDLILRKYVSGTSGIAYVYEKCFQKNILKIKIAY
jgi:hypothetical protein